VRLEGFQRICIFCGDPPEERNREHPLPQWLLALTGDPKRTVTHGFNWETLKSIRFAFDQFAFPACASCNVSWSGIENGAKRVIECLIQKQAMSPGDYVLLLDWLDKVRVGLWLGHRYLQKTPITPNFTINTRVGMKDRMVAVYPVGDHQWGLNVYGAETPLFQFQPSVFALRINNILLLNASWDWMCSARCGYPYPRTLECNVSTGLMEASNFRRRKGLRHPVMSGVMKPCVLLFQPVVMRMLDGGVGPVTREDFDHCLKQAWPARSGLGPVFRQFSDRTIQIGAEDPPIEFDSISKKEARMVRDLTLQAYSLQNASVEGHSYVGDAEKVSEAESHRAVQVRYNRKAVKMLKGLSREQYLKVWEGQGR
jgi:hypothetical protein